MRGRRILGKTELNDVMVCLVLCSSFVLSFDSGAPGTTRTIGGRSSVGVFSSVTVRVRM